MTQYKTVTFRLPLEKWNIINEEAKKIDKKVNVYFKDKAHDTIDYIIKKRSTNGDKDD